MGRQRPADVLAIKERVRRRDANRCVVCLIDKQSHEKRYGEALEVHRIDPGSDYSTDWGVCITLCQVCHNALHGNGHWGWIAKDDPVNEEQLAAWVRRSSSRDEDEEESWRKLEAWGAWLEKLRWAKLGKSRIIVLQRGSGAPVRRCKRVSTIGRLAIQSCLSLKTLQDFEAGRREPLLFEAKRLSTALNITLEELATKKEPDDGWRTLCEERSQLRALVFRAREPKEGEIEGLSRGARLMWDVVGRADEKRAEQREAARRTEEAHRREMLAKQRVVLAKGQVVYPKGNNALP